MKTPTSMLAAALCLSLTPAAFAQDSGWDRLADYQRVPSWQSEDGEASIKLRGRVYYDLAEVDWSSPLGGAQGDRDEFRTARLGLQGEYGDFKFVAEFDFSSSDTKPNDVFIQYSAPVGTIRFGHFKTMNSLDEQTSSRHTSFMERGLATDLFGLDRRIGLAWFWSGHNLYAAAGIFGAPMDDNFRFAERDGSHALAARFAWSDEINGTRLHAGASWRQLDHDQGTRIRAYPQAHLSNRFRAADYRPGSALGEAEQSEFFGLEAAAVRGPFHAQAEFMRLEIDGPAGDPAFNSAYVQAGWFITGETRTYSGSKAVFDRTRPSRSLRDGGPGAWEIAARHDVTDMGDANLGEYRASTLGVNWYPLNHVRMTANYVTAELDAPGFTETSDTVQMRLQFDF
ncbi:OprO/OprP family phosphate-selective porin [Maricaulis parjimensis]|uniref:OprO/OprP family phosphate-selective porin n=1 Tax=Maricaulis parjimensis TaxID=144023 RepID=UPI00193A1766|nr:porin [Maricaulis parjimensis]